MTKKLEEEFNLPPMSQTSIESDDELFDMPDEVESTEIISVEEVQRALTNAEKIDKALSSVKGLEDHSDEMDDIAQQAVDSYQQLMNLGMNVGDREAGSIFDSASKMLTTALQARDSKITAKSGAQETRGFFRCVFVQKRSASIRGGPVPDRVGAE